jgi:hypothetical protein
MGSYLYVVGGALLILAVLLSRFRRGGNALLSICLTDAGAALRKGTGKLPRNLTKLASLISGIETSCGPAKRC